MATKRTKTRYAGVFKLPTGQYQYTWYGLRMPDGSRGSGSALADTLEDARDLRAKTIADQRLRVGQMEAAATPTKMTAGQYFPDFLEQQRQLRIIQEGTYRMYLNALRRCDKRDGVRGILHLLMSDVRGSHIKNLYTDLAARGSIRFPGKGLAPKTIGQVHDLLSSGFGAAVPEYITYNPMERIDKPFEQEIDEQEQDVQHFTVDQARSLLAHALTHDDTPKREGYSRIHAFWVVCFDLGVRIGEAAGIKITLIDQQTGAVRIPTQRTMLTAAIDGSGKRLPGQLVEKSVKGKRTDKNGKLLVLSPQALDIVNAHIRRLKRERLEYGPGYTDSGYLFVRKDGTPYSPSMLRDRHNRLCRMAGVPELSPHKMRHSTATLLYEMGMRAAIQKRLDHANAQTSDIYTHERDEVEIEMQRPAAAAIGSALFG